MNSLLFYKENKIKVIDFPPYSSNLNPIENIWGKIKKEIMKKEYQTLSVMTKDIWKEWDNIRESVEELFCMYEWQNEELMTVKGFNNKVLNNFYFSFNFT